MSPRGLPRLEGRHEYTKEEIEKAEFSFARWYVKWAIPKDGFYFEAELWNDDGDHTIITFRSVEEAVRTIVDAWNGYAGVNIVNPPLKKVDEVVEDRGRLFHVIIGIDGTYECHREAVE